MNSFQEIAVLRSCIDELIEENRQLREAMYGELPLPGKLGLSVTQGRILAALYRARGPARMAVLLTAQSHGRAEIDPDLIRIYICKIRRKLNPFGIDIKVVWRFGYELTAPSRKILDGMVAAAGAEHRARMGLSRQRLRAVP